MTGSTADDRADLPEEQRSAAVADPRQSGELGWFLTDFVRRLPDVGHVVVVSSDGLLLAASDTLPRDRAEELSAVACGIAGLTDAAARCLDAGTVLQSSVDMDHGYLFLMTMGEGALLALLAAPDCEMGLLAYEMTTLVDRVGPRLTPELRARLAASARD
ncbi:roadblock/LC7 domain-containing protein [Actinokineospora sp.]|uniref:roadblock/LC7 domain-containing protein n=1 Tax=Actinokineospora sp. TaxID=1872133 RepID=UPI0040380B5D